MRQHESIFGGSIFFGPKVKPYLAKLNGLDPKYGFNRNFLKLGEADAIKTGGGKYGRADTIGFHLFLQHRENGIYETQGCEDYYKKVKRYFKISDDAVTEISRDEAKAELS